MKFLQQQNITIGSAWIYQYGPVIGNLGGRGGSPLYNKISSFHCYVGSHVTKSENLRFTAVKKQSERGSAGPAAPRPRGSAAAPRGSAAWSLIIYF